MLVEYANIGIYWILIIIIALALCILSFLLVYHKPDDEKLSAYECVFSPFGDARGRFEVKFYLVAILFIIFDLEITFLFPWSVVVGHIGFWGFNSMFIFLFILTIGFVYEWMKGALDW